MWNQNGGGPKSQLIFIDAFLVGEEIPLFASERGMTGRGDY